MHIPLTPPPYDDLITGIDASRFSRVLAAELPSVPGADGYPHWDTLVHLAPPGDLTHEEWWLRLKIQRDAGRKRTPLGRRGRRAFDMYGRPCWDLVHAPAADPVRGARPSVLLGVIPRTGGGRWKPKSLTHLTGSAV